MRNNQRFTGEYLEIDDDDFDEWVADAPTNRLLDAHYEYLTVVESEAKLAGKDGDFTNPDTLIDVSSITENLCVYGPRLSVLQGELYRRHAPVGHAADYRRRFIASLGDAR
jgi:hypothetical protein